MDYVPLLDQIRTMICQTFAELGNVTNQMLHEAVLIRDGYYCGRRFEADGLQAVWFTEENEIKFFDRAGSITHVVELTAACFATEKRRAA